MAEVKWDVTLSVTETNNIGEIKPRQNNENSEVIRVKLTRNGVPYDLTSLKVFFVTKFDAPIQLAATIINAKEGIFDFVFNDKAMQKAGKQEAYFEIYDYDKYLDSTQRFIYNIQLSARKMSADFGPYIESWEVVEEMLDKGAAKVLNDKTENLDLTKADVIDVDNKLSRKTDNTTFVGVTEDMQRQISNTQSGMIGEYNSEAELKAAYPNGTKGYAVVWFTENGQKVGYTYTYKNGSWVKGNVWNGVGIPLKSVTNEKLDDEAVDHIKSVDNIKQAWLFGSTYDSLDIDTVNQKIMFPTGYFLFANGITAKAIPAQVIDYKAETATNLRLCYDLNLDNFVFKVASEFQYSPELLDVGPLRNTKSLSDRVDLNCSFYTVNSKPQIPDLSIDPTQMAGLGAIYFGINGGETPKFSVNGLNITITYPKSYISIRDGKGVFIRQLLTTDIPPVVVNYNKELIWDYKTNVLSVVGYTDARTRSSIVLFSNSYGRCQYGFFKPYFDAQILKENVLDEVGQLPAYLNDGLKSSLMKFSRQEGEFKFAFETDPHYSPTNPYIHKFELLNKISHFGGVDLIVNGGDTTDGIYSSDKSITEIINANMRISKATDYAVLQGNHDTGFAYFYEKYGIGTPSKENSISPNDFHNAALKHLENNFVFDENNRTGGYYFKDYPDSKIRCIFLNSSDCYVLKDNIPQINPMDTYFGEKQLNWLANHALDFSSKTDKSEWGVIVFSHASFNSNSFQVVNGHIAEGLLKAFTEGTSYSGTGSMLAQDFNVTKDFASQGVIEVICGFTGHLHCDGVRQFSFNKPLIFTNCAVPVVNTTPPAWATVPQNREIGTINAECIDLVTINRSEKKIKIIRFGAGENREISY